jgi:hypothetical protein
MKRSLAVIALAGLGLLGWSSEARADHGRWGFSIGVDGIGASFSFGGGHRHRYHGSRHVHRHVCVRQPIYGQVWVEPVYSSCFAGYDACGRARYRTVLVRAGYYSTVVRGYRCGGCGVGGAAGVLRARPCRAAIPTGPRVPQP